MNSKILLLVLFSLLSCIDQKEKFVKDKGIKEKVKSDKEVFDTINPEETFSEWTTQHYFAKLEVDEHKHQIIDSLLLYSESYRQKIKSLNEDITPSLIFLINMFKNELEEAKRRKTLGYSAYGYSYSVGWYYRNIFGGGLLPVPKQPIQRKHVLDFAGLELIIHQYVVRKIERNPANIKKFFEKYKNLIFQLVSLKTYQDAGIDYLVEDLVRTYDKLQKEGYEDYFKELSKHPFQSPYQKGITRQYILNKRYKQQGNTKPLAPSIIPRPGKFYAEHFWHRRYLERNMEVVYEILKEVTNHYKQ